MYNEEAITAWVWWVTEDKLKKQILVAFDQEKREQHIVNDVWEKLNETTLKSSSHNNNTQ